MISRQICLFLLLAANVGAQSITSVIAPTNLPPDVAAGGVYRDVAGVQGGIDQYSTNYTMYVNVKSAGAYGDGVHDDTAVIQNAVNNCPDGEYVYIPTGTYLVTGKIQRTGIYNYDLVQHPFSIIIRGDGPTNTIILNNATSGEIIDFSMSSGPAGNWPISSGNVRGSTSVSVPSAVSIGVNQWVLIERDNTAAGVYAPTNGDPNPLYYVYNLCASQMVKVTNVSGTTFSFTPALNEGFSGDAAGIFFSQPLHCGIEDLCVVRLQDVNAHNIRIIGGEECWVKNVESRQARGYHISLEYCGGSEVRHCYVHDPFLIDSAGGGSDYGITLGFYSSSCLVEDNIALHCRHSFIMETAAGQDNVVAYNYGKDNVNENMFSTDYQMDTDYHGGEQRYCLWEGNVVPIIRADAVEGSTKKVLYYRNEVTMDGIPSMTGGQGFFRLDVQRGNWGDFFYNTVYLHTNTVNVPSSTVYRLGTDGDSGLLDPTVVTNDFWLDNYDFTTGLYDHSANGVIAWNSSASGTNWPSSLVYASKPVWFGTNVWPPIGSDVAGFTNLIPAQTRAIKMGMAASHIGQYTLTVINSAGGSVAIPGNGSYFNTAWVALSANADSSHTFSGWSGYPVANSNSANTYLVMPSANASITANFAAGIGYTLTVNNGTGSGTYVPGTAVTITANVLTGQAFYSWTIPSPGMTGTNTATTTLIMPAGNVTATANFAPFGSGSSPVTTNPPVTSGSIPAPTNGLVAWYAFDDGSGSTAADSSGNGNTGTLVNSPAWTSGIIGSGALSFNGNNQYVGVADSDSLSFVNNVFTFVFWLKAPTQPENSTSDPRHPILSKWNQYTGGEYSIYILDAQAGAGKGKITVMLDGASEGSIGGVASTIAMDDNKWHFVAITSDGTTNSIYVDGKLNNSAMLGVDLMRNTAAPLDIGWRQGTTGFNPFLGILDDVRIYNRALSADETQSVFLDAAATKSSFPWTSGKLIVKPN